MTPAKMTARSAAPDMTAPGGRDKQASQDHDVDISQDVLYGIAQLALDGVEGITPVAPPARVGEILTGRRAKGIRIERAGDALSIDLNVHVLYGLAIPKVAKEAQKAVREAVASMTGLRVETVNVTVDAVDLPPPSQGEERPGRGAQGLVPRESRGTA